MRYSSAVSALYALAPRGVSPGLGRLRRALSSRGHPERAFGSVLIAGTNGKGSVAAMVGAGLHAAGVKVGIYTSPQLHRLVERFVVGGRPVSQAELARRVAELTRWLARPEAPLLTFFEACTLLAFEIFRDARVDVAVLEVGLGGRLDATNVVRPLLSVITRVGLDHQRFLGPTLAHIAEHKAGIIKRGVPVVSAPQPAAVRRVIAATAQRRRARLHEARVGSREPPLPGRYQSENLAVALAALEALRHRGLPIDERTIVRGLSRVRWPGRLELVEGRPSVLFDAAHNPDACRALAAELARLAPRFERRVLVLGAMRDKDIGAMWAALRPAVSDVVLTTAATERALPAAELAARLGGTVIDDPLEALREAKRRATRAGLVVVAGSIFLMGPLRAAHLGLRTDPPIGM